MTTSKAPAPQSEPTLREALRIFIGCAYPVSTEIDLRGHRWSEAYLDQALETARAALAAVPQSEPVAIMHKHGDKIDGYSGLVELLKPVAFGAKLYASPVAAQDAPGLSDAGEALLAYAESRECHHDSTHRGGAIWTICDDCDRKWSDDRDPFKPYKEPAAITNMRAALARKTGGTP